MPEETLSLLLEFSESTKGGANGLSGREKVGLFDKKGFHLRPH